MELVRANGNGNNEVAAATVTTTTTRSDAWYNILRFHLRTVADSVFIPCKPPSILPLLPFHWAWGSYCFRRHRRVSSAVIGTILRPDDSNSMVTLWLNEPGVHEPFLLLDLPLSIHNLLDACRITLECESGGPLPLLAMPTWSVYCNGRKVGFGYRRERTEGDAWAADTIRAVPAGTGVVPEVPGGGGGRLRYMRSTFGRVVGSDDCESYHLMDSMGWVGQELSFFFLRV